MSSATRAFASMFEPFGYTEFGLRNVELTHRNVELTLHECVLCGLYYTCPIYVHINDHHRNVIEQNGGLSMLSDVKTEDEMDFDQLWALIEHKRPHLQITRRGETDKTD